MFEWSWGYYSIFDADAILYDVMKCNQPYSYYCNKALDDLVVQGRSTLDTKKRAEIYAKAQKLIHDDAAYLFKWGLRGVWGVSSRIDYEAPRDEVDRMFARDAAEEVGAPPGPGPASPAGPAAFRPRMRRYLARQLVQLVVVILGISLLAFGDPARPRRSRPPAPAPERRQGGVRALPPPARPRPAALRAVLEVRLPRRGQGDFGKSWYADTPAFKLVLERMPPTIYLTFAGLRRRPADRPAPGHRSPRSAATPGSTACARRWRWPARRRRCSGSASC